MFKFYALLLTLNGANLKKRLDGMLQTLYDRSIRRHKTSLRRFAFEVPSWTSNNLQ